MILELGMMEPPWYFGQIGRDGDLQKGVHKGDLARRAAGAT